MRFWDSSHRLPDTRIGNILRFMGVMKVAREEAFLIAERIRS